MGKGVGKKKAREQVICRDCWTESVLQDQFICHCLIMKRRGHPSLSTLYTYTSSFLSPIGRKRSLPGPRLFHTSLSFNH
ncbi:Uncharacterized protein APZ42_017506 [Daphnia magna]|uniref:Uncharacterized protein n=1 Tax=Daphnia magna TaxID=35525 RepID=A0A164ZWQ7_9CRUS|nr:Uncharacterized protein APZ42_017506 [Daphnia magna]